MWSQRSLARLIRVDDGNDEDNNNNNTVKSPFNVDQFKVLLYSMIPSQYSQYYISTI
jgi:hypothetical protein